MGACLVAEEVDGESDDGVEHEEEADDVGGDGVELRGHQLVRVVEQGALATRSPPVQVWVEDWGGGYPVDFLHRLHGHVQAVAGQVGAHDGHHRVRRRLQPLLVPPHLSPL